MKMYIGYSIGDYNSEGKADFVMSAIIVRSSEKINEFYEFLKKQINKLDVEQEKKNAIKSSLSFGNIKSEAKNKLMSIIKEGIQKRFRGVSFIYLKETVTKDNLNEIIYNSLVRLYDNSFNILDIYAYFPNEIEQDDFKKKFSESRIVNFNPVIKNGSNGNKIAGALSFCIRKSRCDQIDSDYLKENEVTLLLKA